LLVPLVAILAGCGGTKTYSAEKSRACLLAKGKVVSGPPASDLVASAAEGGSYTVRFGKNFATVSFGTDRDGAERIVRAYQRFRGKNIGLLDVLSAKGNAVMLWAIHPEDTDVRVRVRAALLVEEPEQVEGECGKQDDRLLGGHRHAGNLLIDER
jgi:hypothetical protein